MELFYFFLAIFFITGSFIEFYHNRHADPGYYSTADITSSIKLMLLALIIDLIVKAFAIYALSRLSYYSVFDISYAWWAWVLCYFLWDLVFYIKHYHEHNVRFMWAIHVNHHSSEHMNLSTSLRSGVLKSGYRYFYWAVPILIGFPLPMFLVLYGVAKIWAFFSHSQKLGRWGVLEKLTVTPTHHLLHHSYNDENLNKNFGETFIVWDKLFGTFRETSESLKFGIGQKIDHANFREVVFHEFDAMVAEVKEAKGFRKKMKIIFGPPRQHLT